MNEIKMIPIDKLYHHPENPRKDLGDLSELTESIRERGVMQNLTVIKGHWMNLKEWESVAKAEGIGKEEAKGLYDAKDAFSAQGFTVVIGNRRLEASKAAGLAELPCVVSDMDHKEQIATMLMENMQRQDLTTYEQAQGFQMMMDIGFTKEEISERTGFSESTVRRRLKMAELDKDAFKKAVGKQITIEDLDRLSKVDSLKQRNALLKEFGNDNFSWKVTAAIRVQEAAKKKPAVHKMIQEAKIKKLPEDGRYSYGKYRHLYANDTKLNEWDGKENFIPKTDEELFYWEDDTSISFYVKEKKQKSNAPAKTEEEKEEEKRIALAWKSAERVEEVAYENRKSFAEKLKVGPKNAMEMLQWALIAAMEMSFDYDAPTQTMRKKLKMDYSTQDNLAKIREWMINMPQSKWPAVILMFFEGDKGKENGYTSGAVKDWPKYKGNRKLDHCYEWLQHFGYQMSEEEIQMQSGNHPCFRGKVDET